MPNKNRRITDPIAKFRASLDSDIQLIEHYSADDIEALPHESVLDRLKELDVDPSNLIGKTKEFAYGRETLSPILKLKDHLLDESEDIEHLPAHEIEYYSGESVKRRLNEKGINYISNVEILKNIKESTKVIKKFRIMDINWSRVAAAASILILIIMAWDRIQSARELGRLTAELDLVRNEAGARDEQTASARRTMIPLPMQQMPKRELERVTAEIAALKAERTDLRARLGEAKHTIANQVSTRDELVGQISSATDTAQRCVADVKNLGEQLIAAMAHLEQLEAALAESQSGRAALAAEIASMRREVGIGVSIGAD